MNDQQGRETKVTGAYPAARTNRGVSACESRQRLTAFIPVRRSGRCSWWWSDVGLHLVREAEDLAPDILTWRERYVLSVLAHAAIDETRECPHGIEDRPEIIKRLRLTRSERYAVLASLCDKGALLRLERGPSWCQAVYANRFFRDDRLPEGSGETQTLQDPASGPKGLGNPDPTTKDRASKGPGNPDASESASPVKGPETPDATSAKGPGNPDPIGERPGLKPRGKTPPTPPPGQRPMIPSACQAKPRGRGTQIDKPDPDSETPELRPLVTEIRGMRSGKGWSAESITRALEDAHAVDHSWSQVFEAMRIVASDPETDRPGRLPFVGPWWPEAARRILARTAVEQVPASQRHQWTPDQAGNCTHCDLPRTNRRHQEAS